MRTPAGSLLILSSLLALNCDPSIEAAGVDGSTTPIDANTSETAPDPDTMTMMGTVNPLEGMGTVKLVATGYGFTEGTSWNASGGFLLFTDFPNNSIYKLMPPSTVTVFRLPSGNAIGLAWGPMGRLLAAEHGNRRVSSITEGGTSLSIAERFDGKELNSPNDLIAKSDGNI